MAFDFRRDREPLATHTCGRETLVQPCLFIQASVAHALKGERHRAMCLDGHRASLRVLGVTDLYAVHFASGDEVDAAHAAPSISDSAAIARSYLASVMVFPASRAARVAPDPRTWPEMVAGARPVAAATALIRAMSC